MKWIVVLLALPALVAGYLFQLLCAALFITDPRTLRFAPGAVLTARIRERVAARWGFSTTIGMSIVFHPVHHDDTADVDSRIERHEYVHVRQFQDDCVCAFFLGLALFLWNLAEGASLVGALGLWAAVWCSGMLWMLPNFLTAALRFGPKGIYLDSEHERSAYAQTDVIRVQRDGKSEFTDWSLQRDARREQQQSFRG